MVVKEQTGTHADDPAKATHIAARFAIGLKRGIQFKKVRQRLLIPDTILLVDRTQHFVVVLSQPRSVWLREFVVIVQPLLDFFQDHVVIAGVLIQS